MDAERIDKLLTAEATKSPANRGTLEQRRADVFVDHLLTRGGKPDDPPGESFDGQFALPADLVRDLAAEPGTLFHRIITDPRGPTHGANLKTLCKRHHQMKTHQVVTTSIDEHGHHWHLPTGHTITSETRTLPTGATTLTPREADLAHWILTIQHAA